MPGEKVAYNDGAGWDGLAYRDVATNFLDQAQNQGFNHYMIQRLLPFALLNLSFHALNIPLQNDTLMTGILLLNFLTLLLGIAWYISLVKHLKLSQNLQILGFILLFLNFPLLKVTWYEPFVTDLFAFVIGIGQLNFFVRKRKLSLLILTIISGFVWPTALLIGLILLILPTEKPSLTTQSFQFKKWMTIIPVIIAILMTVAFFKFSSRADKPISELIRHQISLMAILVLIYGILKNIYLNWKENIKQLFHQKNWINIALLLIAIVAFYSVVKVLSNGEPSFGIKPFLVFLLVRPIQLPLNFLVNHFLYFGMLIPIAIYYFKDVFAISIQKGISFIMVFFAMMILALNSEARMIINVIPFLLLPVLLLLKDFKIQTSMLLGFAAVNLLLSKFWYSINAPGIAVAYETYDTAVYLTFPAQRYFQHFGPWQNTQMYFIYAVGLILALTLLKYLHPYWSDRHSNPTPSLAK